MCAYIAAPKSKRHISVFGQIELLVIQDSLQVATTLMMCQGGLHVRLIVFEIEYLKIERVLVKYYKAKSLDDSPGKSLKLRYTPLTWEPTTIYINIYIYILRMLHYPYKYKLMQTEVLQLKHHAVQYGLALFLSFHQWTLLGSNHYTQPRGDGGPMEKIFI